MECDELVNSNPKIYHMWHLFSKEIYQDKIKDFIIDLSEDKDRKKKSKSKRVNKLFVLLKKNDFIYHLHNKQFSAGNVSYLQVV